MCPDQFTVRASVLTAAPLGTHWTCLAPRMLVGTSPCESQLILDWGYARRRQPLGSDVWKFSTDLGAAEWSSSQKGRLSGVIALSSCWAVGAEVPPQIACTPSSIDVVRAGR